MGRYPDVQESAPALSIGDRVRVCALTDAQITAVVSRMDLAHSGSPANDAVHSAAQSHSC